MKNFKSTEEGVWTADAGTVSTPEKNSLIAIYNTNKPNVVVNPHTGITPVYQLIQVDIALEGTTLVKGLLNCRVDDEHTQIRF